MVSLALPPVRRVSWCFPIGPFSEIATPGRGRLSACLSYPADVITAYERRVRGRKHSCPYCERGVRAPLQNEPKLASGWKGTQCGPTYLNDLPDSLRG